MLSSQIIVSENNINWPAISFVKNLVVEEKNTLKKIVKLFFSIILSPAVLFLDITYNIGTFFCSKTINFINSKIQKDEKKQPIGLIEKTKSIWQHHKKALIIGSIVLGTSLAFGYLYYSIRPLLSINRKYDNCVQNANDNLTFLREKYSLKKQAVKKQISETSLFDSVRRNKLAQRLYKIGNQTLGELKTAKVAFYKKNLICKNNYTASLKKIKTKYNSLFNLFKY